MSAAFLCRVVLPPLLVAVATLSGRRFGPASAGWWSSLPVVGGPVLAVVTLDHGAHFGTAAARSGTLGVASVGLFAALYTLLASRGRPWWACLIAGYALFAATTAALSLVRVPVILALVFTLAVLATAQALVRSGDGPPVGSGRRLPGDLGLRVLAALGLVLLLTALAGVLGPRVTGLIAPFPVIGSVMAAFIHVVDGAGALRAYSGTLLRGLPSFALFTTALALTLPALSVGGAFAVAVGLALVSHAALIARS